MRSPGSVLQEWLGKAGRIVGAPSEFFSRLKESSWEPIVGWLVAWSALMVWGGGVLSVGLSGALGIPLQESLGFLKESDALLLGYGVFLGVWWAEVLIAILILTVIIHGFSRIVGGKGSFRESVQVVGYGLTPVFVAFALPEVLAQEVAALTPLLRVVATSSNYMVDMLQVGSLVWFMGLAWIGIQQKHACSRVRAGCAVAGTVMVVVLVVAVRAFFSAMITGS